MSSHGVAAAGKPAFDGENSPNQSQRRLKRHVQQGRSGSSIQQYPALDGLRALSIIGVVVGHVGGRLGGYYGVTVFFVISGFLISSILISGLVTDGSISFSSFYRRRFARLMPGLVLVLGATVIWLVISRVPIGTWWVGLLGSLTYSTDIALMVGLSDHIGDFFEWSWSLGVEEQFYIVWPAILLVAYRMPRPRAALTVICLVIIVMGWFSRAYLSIHGASHEREFYALDTHMDAMAVGALIALLSPVAHGKMLSHRFMVLTRVGGWLSLCGLAAFVYAPAATARFGWLDRNGFGSVALLSGVLVASVTLLSCGLLCRILSWRVLRYIGTRSYSLYLWNLLTISIVAAVVGNGGRLSGATAGVAIILSLVIAEVSYRYVERPLRARWSQPRRTG